jgi:hypothetical protein
MTQIRRELPAEMPVIWQAVCAHTSPLDELGDEQLSKMADDCLRRAHDVACLGGVELGHLDPMSGRRGRSVDHARHIKRGRGGQLELDDHAVEVFAYEPDDRVCFADTTVIELAFVDTLVDAGPTPSPLARV